MVSAWIWSAPVCFFTSSRAAVIKARGSSTDLRIRAGRADFVSRPDPSSTASGPRAATAARTDASAPNVAVVVSSSWAMSDCKCSSVAPYSELPKPPNSTVPESSTVISEERRSPWEIWWRCRTASDSHTVGTDPASALSSGVPRGGVWENMVQPRSRPATVRVAVFATPRSPAAMVISARCSTARCMDVCRGAVSLSRNTSQRQNWRSAPPLRWLGPYNSTTAPRPESSVAANSNGPLR